MFICNFILFNLYFSLSSIQSSIILISNCHARRLHKLRTCHSTAVCIHHAYLSHVSCRIAGLSRSPVYAVNGDCVALHTKMLGGHRRELLATRVILVVFLDHILTNFLRTLSDHFLDIVGLACVRVDATVLQVIVAKENYKMTSI